MQSYGLNEHNALILKFLLGKKLAYYRITMFKTSIFLLETTQMPFSQWMVKQSAIFIIWNTVQQ